MLADARHSARGGDVEIVVADCRSTDGTVAVAGAMLEGFPAHRIVSCGRGRGGAMNAGAAVATGEVLLFLHSDTALPSGWLGALREIMGEPQTQAGCFRHRFDGRHPALRLISRLHDARFRATGVIYGDQTLFIRAELFRSLAGFREDRVMEDVEFSERLLAVTRPVRVDLAVETSSRKFEQIGVYRAFAQVIRLLLGYELGRRNPSAHAFFKNYR